MAKKSRQVLRFDMPFTSEPPPMQSESLGLQRLMERGAARRTTDVTIIDSTDHRLLRAGVVLAHRVSDQTGEWYLAASGWDPWLPVDHVERLGASAELPEGLAGRIRPISRRALLGPVASQRCERSEYALRSTDGDVLAEIHDQKVTLRRGGVTTARYREATVVPVVTLTPSQREFILGSMESAAATPVVQFPSLQQRLGPPATGLTDFPAPAKLRRGADMEDFVTALFSADLQQLVETLLELQQSERPDPTTLVKLLNHVRRDVRGLTPVLEPGWRMEVEMLTEPVDGESPLAVAERALDVVEALVVAVRAPKLGDSSYAQARTLLFRRAERSAFILADRCRALTPDASDKNWAAALLACEQLQTTAEVGAQMFGKRGNRIVQQLQLMTDDLHSCIAEPADVDPAGLTPQEAFALGAAEERRRTAVLGHRERFVASWPNRVANLRHLLAKVQKKL